MSRGPGSIESAIANLFAATRDRALSIEEISRVAFGLGRKEMPTRVQRLSATRAAHRVLRRVRELEDRADALRDQARENTRTALGHDREDGDYDARLRADPAWKAAERLGEEVWRIGIWVRGMPTEHRGRLTVERDFWCATTIKKRLWLHPPDVPVQVWAVTMDRSGVHWFAAEVAKVTERNVMVRYRGEMARLDRQRLFYWWAWYRAVRFVSSRTGRIAAALEAAWWGRYGTAGSTPPAMQMPLEQARLMLGLPADYNRDDVIAAFRRKAKEAHPDLGGTAEMFRALVEARDRLLTALGTSAPPPKPPDYAPKGAAIVYRSGRGSSQRRLGSGSHRLR